MTCDIIHKNFSKKKKTQKTATVICSWRCYKKLTLNISDIIVESNEFNVLSNVLSYRGHFSLNHNWGTYMNVDTLLLWTIMVFIYRLIRHCYIYFEGNISAKHKKLFLFQFIDILHQTPASKWWTTIWIALYIAKIRWARSNHDIVALVDMYNSCPRYTTIDVV